jgi:gliding motility-associated-like protein
VGRDTINIVVHAAPNINVNLQSDICQNEGSVAITRSPLGGVLSGNGVSGTTFDPLDGTVTAGQEHKVYYFYTDGNNCSATDSTTVVVHAAPTPSMVIQDSSICIGSAVELSINPGGATNLVWYKDPSPTSIGTGETINLSTAGQYYVVASDAHCSSKSDMATITVITPVVEAFASTNPVEEGEPVTLFVAEPEGTYSYVWQDLTGGNTHNGPSWLITPNTSGSYIVNATQNGCMVSATIELIVQEELSIPHAFTPNGDGVNDIWLIPGIESYSNTVVRVFNRWGAEIFTASGSFEGWNGTNNGTDVPAGSYYFIIELNGEKPSSISGYVMVIR